MIEIKKIQQEAKEQGVSANLPLKEKVHHLILDHLFKEGAFSELVFQGGTALRLFYKGVRYSEDLDFVLKKKASPFLKKAKAVLQKLPAYLDKFLPFARSIELKAQKEAARLQRFQLTMAIEGFSAKDKTNIEIMDVPSHAHEVKMLSQKVFAVSPAVCVEKQEEILADKVYAFGSRAYVKGRDIWDLYFMRDSMQLQMDQKTQEMVSQKIYDYNSTKDKFLTGFEKHLVQLKAEGNEILKKEMERFLPLAYRNIYVSQYGSIVAKVAESLEGFYAKCKNT